MRCFIMLCMVCAMHTSLVADNIEKRNIEVFYEGQKFQKINTLLLENGFGYIPVKDVAALYRMTLTWKTASKEVVLSMHSTDVVAKFNSKEVIISNIPRLMNKETKEVQGMLCVPLELVLTQAFAEATRCSTVWNNSTGTLEVDKKTNIFLPHIYSQTNETRIRIDYDQYIRCADVVKKDKITLTFENGIWGDEESIVSENGIVKKITVKQQRKKVVMDIFLTSDTKIPTITYDEKTSGINITILHKKPVAVEQKRKSDTGKKTIIVLDPGHGGKDPGAIGRNGTKEKDINLTMALKLGKQLEREGGFKIIFTRRDDTFIPLLERTEIANTHKADIFVSIHCNSSLKKTSEGFEIYFLAGEATDEAARATAQLENSALQLEEDSRVRKKRIDQLLWSIAQNMFHRESANVCASVLQQVQKRVKINKRFAKQAKFYVLMNAKMPAILIENGFLSNKKEEAVLKTRRYQAKLVDAYYAGIMDYFNKK